MKHGTIDYSCFLSAVLVLGLTFCSSAAYGQTIDYVREFGTPGDDSALAVDVNSTGVYLGGFVIGTLPGQTRTGFRDAFARKYDSDGNDLWTRQFGTTLQETTHGGAVDSTGYYIGGGTNGIFPDQAGGIGFVRKFDFDGT